MPGKPQSLQIDIPSIEGIHKTVAREARDMRERRDAGCGVPETSDLESSSVPPVLPAITQNPGDRLRFEDRSLRSEATASNRGPPTSLPHASDIQPPTLVLPLRTQNSKLRTPLPILLGYPTGWNHFRFRLDLFHHSQEAPTERNG
jgi:hypothetical protein